MLERFPSMTEFSSCVCLCAESVGREWGVELLVSDIFIEGGKGAL